MVKHNIIIVGQPYSLDALFSNVLKASITNNNKEGNYPQYQICDGLMYFKDWNGNFQEGVTGRSWDMGWGVV